MSIDASIDVVLSSRKTRMQSIANVHVPDESYKNGGRDETMECLLKVMSFGSYSAQ